MNLMTFLLAVFSVSLNALAQVAMRKTMLSLPPFPTLWNEGWGYVLGILLNPWFIGSMSCYAISIVVWMMVLGKAEVSLAYPLLSIGYIITAVIGYFFLKEDLNSLRIIGLLLICAGIIFISRSA